ncbi:hypothetical protein DFH06DRAFT_1132816 [Mycena polygramma]|nr:hypothetical protein DFH06DRAFT_1132816 [Mycena polygramma]
MADGRPNADIASLASFPHSNISSIGEVTVEPGLFLPPDPRTGTPREGDATVRITEDFNVEGLVFCPGQQLKTRIQNSVPGERNSPNNIPLAYSFSQSHQGLSCKFIKGLFHTTTTIHFSPKMREHDVSRSRKPLQPKKAAGRQAWSTPAILRVPPTLSVLSAPRKRRAAALTTPTQPESLGKKPPVGTRGPYLQCAVFAAQSFSTLWLQYPGGAAARRRHRQHDVSSSRERCKWPPAGTLRFQLQSAATLTPSTRFLFQAHSPAFIFQHPPKPQIKIRYFAVPRTTPTSFISNTPPSSRPPNQKFKFQASRERADGLNISYILSAPLPRQSSLPSTYTKFKLNTLDVRLQSPPLPHFWLKYLKAHPKFKAIPQVNPSPGHLGHLRFCTSTFAPLSVLQISDSTLGLPHFLPLISTAAYLRERRDYDPTRNYISQQSGYLLTTTRAD